MNEIVNKFLLVGDKFMPEMHLKQPGFTYSACGPFTRNIVRSTVIMTRNKFITKLYLAFVFMMVLEVISQKSILGNFFIRILNYEQF